MSDTTTEPKYLTKQGAADHIGVSISTFHRMSAEHVELRPLRLRPRILRYSRERIDRWMERQTEA